MENANSPEYLEKIKNAVIENLKKTIPAPSVQMQDVPRQGFGTTTDEDDAALDDEDEDNNKDVRLTQRGFDKRVVADNEFEESDDEEMAEANGVYQTAGKRKGIQDYKNPFSQDDYEPAPAQNGNEQPTPAPEAQDKAANDEGDETMEDVDVEVQEEKEPEKEAAVDPAPQAAPVDAAAAQVDNDGDVDMVEAGEPEVAPSIKQEEADVQPTNAAADPAPAPETDQGNDKPSADVAKDGTPAPAAVEQSRGEGDGVPPASEAKEAEKTDQEKPESPAKPVEATEDGSKKKDGEEAAMADEGKATAAGSSGGTAAEN